MIVVIMPSAIVLIVQMFIGITLGFNHTIVAILAAVLGFWIVAGSLCVGLLILLNRLGQRLDSYLLEHAPRARPWLVGLVWVAALAGGAGGSGSSDSSGGDSGGGGASGSW